MGPPKYSVGIVGFVAHVTLEISEKHGVGIEPTLLPTLTFTPVSKPGTPAGAVDQLRVCLSAPYTGTLGLLLDQRRVIKKIPNADKASKMMMPARILQPMI